MDIKNIMIFLVIFFIILWLQHNDDIKNNVKRTNLYDKIKIPLVSALFVILIKEFNYKQCETFVKSFIIIKEPVDIINKSNNFKFNNDIEFNNDFNFNNDPLNNMLIGKVPF
jgi:hypothetical protein